MYFLNQCIISVKDNRFMYLLMLMYLSDAIKRLSKKKSSGIFNSTSHCPQVSKSFIV